MKTSEALIYCMNMNMNMMMNQLIFGRFGLVLSMSCYLRLNALFCQPDSLYFYYYMSHVLHKKTRSMSFSSCHFFFYFYFLS